MNKEMKVYLKSQQYTLPRDLLQLQTQNNRLKYIQQDSLTLPDWVTKQAYFLIFHYLQTKDVIFLKEYVKDNSLVVNLLRTSDFLGLTKFQDIFINQIILPEISFDNCLVLLDESHRKLKSMQNSQSWFKLLNEGINYLSKNLFEIYKVNPQKLKSLNQKIMNQVLDIVIRQQRKTGFKNQHILYQLIIQCKSKAAKGPQNLCKYLRSVLQHKKIVPKIHAKLSWKLQRVQQINGKKTKNFKFLDYRWFLSADRKPQGLLVTLNLIPYNSDQSVQGSSYKSQSKLGTQSNIGSQKYNLDSQNNEDCIKNDRYTKIAVFYSKVTYKTEEKQTQKEIKIFYSSINKNLAIPIINFTNHQQKQIGSKRVQLTIFFNIDLIYTFFNNYIFTNFECLNYKGHNFHREQLENMIEMAKQLKKFTKALKMINQYLFTYKEQKKQDIRQLFCGFDFLEMTKVQIQIFQNLRNTEKCTPKKQQQPEIRIMSSNYTTNSRNRYHNSQDKVQNAKKSPINQTIFSNKQKMHDDILFQASNTYDFKNSKNNENLIVMSRENTVQRALNIGKITRIDKVDQNSQTSLNNSITNSRTNSKRKIFNKPKSTCQKGQFEVRHQNQSMINPQLLFPQIINVTDFSKYLKINCDPYIAKQLSNMYIK